MVTMIGMVSKMIAMKPLDTLITPRECALKLLEEASEACEVLKEYDKVHEWHTYQDALLELADVAQCMCNCLQALNATSDEWDDAIEAVQEHNKQRGRNDVSGARAMCISWDW